MNWRTLSEVCIKMATRKKQLRRRQQRLAVMAISFILLAGCASGASNQSRRDSQEQNQDLDQPAAMRKDSIQGDRDLDRLTALSRDLASQISVQAKYGASIQRIAILPLSVSDRAKEYSLSQGSGMVFLYAEASKMLQDTLPDALRTEIFRAGRYEIVADRDMSRVIEQLHIQDTLHAAGRYLDPDSRIEIGEMVNAQALLEGSISRSENRLRIAFELVDVGTNRVVAVAQSLYP